MIVKFLLPLALLAAPLSAQTAARATAVHAQPSASSPVIRLIKAGEDLPAPAAAASAPVGWSAVTLSGPHEVYVENRFIGKDLEVKAGSPLRTSPQSDAPVLFNSATGDAMEITGLRGRWTQLRVSKSVTGFVQGAGTVTPARTAPVVTSTPVQDAPRDTNASAASNPPPAVGRQVTRSAEERDSLAALPRLFEGSLVSTRAPLRPRRPYDFALEAEDGTRFAYVDLNKLLLTQQIENYLNRTVVVYGVARPVPDTKDIVISVESLQLR